jgi:hypothetical protein
MSPLMVVGSTLINWNHVLQATSGRLWYSIVLLAIVMVFGLEIWSTTRGTRPALFSLATAVVAIAGLAVVGVRFVALAR